MKTDDQEADSQLKVQLYPAAYVTVKLAASITGLSEKAIRNKMAMGKWLDGREYRRSPDGGIYTSMKGYERWVEGAPATRRCKAEREARAKKSSKWQRAPLTPGWENPQQVAERSSAAAKPTTR